MPNSQPTPRSVPSGPPPTLPRVLLGVLLIWALASASVFLLYGALEPWLMGELPDGSRDTAHLLRGMTASLLAALGTAIYLLNIALPSLERSLHREAAAPQDESAGVALARWSIGLRWIAVLATATVVGAATLLTERVEPQAAWALWAGVATLLVMNAGLALADPRRIASPAALTAQVGVDVLVLGWLVHHAGGIANPFSAFFVYHAVIAAVLLGTLRAQVLSGAAALFVLGLTAVQATGLLSPACLRDAAGTCLATPDPVVVTAIGVGIAATMVGCAGIVSAIGRVLRAERDQLARTSAELSAKAEALAREVREHAEAQRELVRKERMAVVGKLAAGVAHEINNPLGAIALFTQHALAELPPDHPLADHLGTVMRNANNCKRIVRDLLEYARQRPPEVREVEATDVLGDVVRTLAPRAQASQVQIELELDDNPTLHADPDQLRQVLVNLGLNGIEAMPDGGLLRIRTHQAVDGGTCIEVIDTGAGIPSADHERIFSAFYTDKAEGTGLGLSVALDLVTAHGGRIDLESAPGRGSTFSVHLPFRADLRALEAAS